MTHQEIREKFLKFFESRGHKIVPSSSLLPDDPSVLFTTAGMQQFKPYFLGKADPMKDFGSKRTTSIQKAMRTSDIDEVGDESHLTFFEMLGHFSFGDYFKKETIGWTHQLLTEVFKISPNRISATVFAGDDKIPFDSESYNAWSKFLPADHIHKGPREDNVWGPPGPEGPCGAANEVYVDDLEIATLVFMEYNCDKDKNLTSLPQKGVDVGWGLERIVKVIQDKDNIFETDLFEPIISALPDEIEIRTRRIIADHMRAISFLISDGVRPSNKDQGYVLRKLMRRVITYKFKMDMGWSFFGNMFETVVNNYGVFYKNLDKIQIEGEFTNEENKFLATLTRGLSELEKRSNIDAREAFMLYESYGLPYEIIKEFGEVKAEKLTREAFDEEYKKHQEKSRAGAEKKFGGHGIVGEAASDETKIKTRLHTATHILFAALEKVLGQELPQAGSDINAERLRFDFAFPRKLTPEEIKKAETLANKIVSDNLEVWPEELPLQEALDSGAHGVFKHKYPPRVKIYTVGPKRGWFSREICGGPHISHTGEIGRITIIKEESVSGGNRRIRAVVE